MLKGQTGLNRSVLIVFLLLAGMLMALAMPSLAEAAASAAVSSDSHSIKSVFSDVPSTDPNLIYINYLNQSKIIQGFPDGSYHPSDGLTRAQAAVVVAKAAGLKIDPVEKSSFKDVPANHWAAPYIEAVGNYGIISSFSGNLYKPDQKLTRAEAISLVMRLSTHTERAVLPSLQDMKSDNWAAPEMATALALQMIGTSQDRKQVYPDTPMTRSDLARTLAILLVQDPGLNQVSLVGRIKDVSGDITLIRNGTTQSLVNDMSIIQGDIIKSGDGKANIVYPDGSSTLIEANSELIIKQATGRNYIKLDGSPGVAVDFLNIEMKQGTLLGALATRQEENEQQSRLSSRLASQDGFNWLAAAAAENGVPWYKTAEQKKVKVKVDMPWGIAAIRGTFYKVTVAQDGSCNVSCLTGNADVVASNQATVALTGNQSSSITAPDTAPSAAAAMSPADVQAFAVEQQWIVDTALNIDLNQAAPPAEMIIEVPGTPSEVSIEDHVTTTLQIIIDALETSGIQLTNEVKADLEQQLQEIEQKSLNPYQSHIIELSDSSLSQNSTNTQTTSTNTTAAANTTSNTTTNTTGSSPSALVYSQAGTYGSSSSSSLMNTPSVIVNAEGITLQNMKITGNLTVSKQNTTLNNVTVQGNLVLASGIADGKVSMNSVTVNGNTSINGGGSASIHIADSQLSTVTVNKTNNDVRVVAEGHTSMGTLTLNSGAILEESGLDAGAEGYRCDNRERHSQRLYNISERKLF